MIKSIAFSVLRWCVGQHKDGDTREENQKCAVGMSMNCIILYGDLSIEITLQRDLPIMLKSYCCLSIAIILH